MPRYDSFGARDTQILSAGDTFFNRINARLRPDQLKPGEVAYSQNGRMDLDGAFQPRKGVDYFGGTPSVSSEALIIPFYLYANVNISSASRVNTLVTVDTSTNHNFNDQTQVGIAGLTGTVSPNGNRTVTVIDANTFTFVIPGATGSETYTGSGTAGAGYLSANNNFCFGSCLYSDPKDDNAEYFILALNEKAVAIASDGTSTDIEYPSGITIQDEVELIQAFDKVYIFRDGLTALEWDGDFTGTPAFVKVANGAYSQPVYLDANNNTAILNGVVTVSETSHGLSVGDRIFVVDNGPTGLVEDSVGYVVATVPTANSFTFYAEVPDHASHTIVYTKRISNGRGFTHMPAPPWGVYHQRRLIVPFYYTTTGTSGSEVITDREVRDELLISDILDGETYDQLQNVFKVTAGIADYLQWVHPFTEDQAIAFNRNSIHLISGLSGDLTDVGIAEVTREAGLVAKRSVVTIANKIFFLSDNGVYAASFGDLYNLRGAGLPLSAEIDPIIKRINPEFAYKAVAIFHDNRYRIAVPLDTSERNNCILTYNLINEGWESVDIINQTGWDVSNFIKSGAGGVDKLYAVNYFGGIHTIDERVDDVDRIVTYPGIAAQSYYIPSYAITRQYTMDMSDRKKFNSFELHVESTATNASDAALSVETENMDETVAVGNLSSFFDGSAVPVGEDASIRGRIGNIRGYGLQLTFTPSAGRPKLRMVRINAMPAFNSQTQVS